MSTSETDATADPKETPSVAATTGADSNPIPNLSQSDLHTIADLVVAKMSSQPGTSGESVPTEGLSTATGKLRLGWGAYRTACGTGYLTAQA